MHCHTACADWSISLHVLESIIEKLICVLFYVKSIMSLTHHITNEDNKNRYNMLSNPFEIFIYKIF